MKRAVTGLLALLICLSFSALADWNVQNLTDEELLDYKRAIIEELVSRHKTPALEGETKISDLFPDPVIANAVRGEVGAITIDAVVTQDELDSITKIKLLSHDDGVTSIEGIQHLRNLEDLALYWQDGLIEVPEEIGELTSLKYLYFRKCGITELPDTICDLVNLREFDINGTGVSKLPDDIGNLTSLKKLDISYTKITDLPESIYALDLEKFYR